jgi:RNA polymerase sigma-70 factor (ECF subfamily)
VGGTDGRRAGIARQWAASDEALLAGLGSGDGDAAAAFLDRFSGRVHGLALGLLGDRAAAEEVAQEAFLRAWRHAGAFDARRGSVTTWLLTITRNLAIDALRVRRTLPADPSTLLDLRAADGPGPDDLAGTADDVSRLTAALSRLPEDQRRAIVLARFHGCTAAEVGRLEGIPLGTAKTRIRTALLRLRDVLAEEAPR